MILDWFRLDGHGGHVGIAVPAVTEASPGPPAAFDLPLVTGRGLVR